MSDKKKYWYNIFLLTSALLLTGEYYILIIHKNYQEINTYKNNFSIHSFSLKIKHQKINFKNISWLGFLQRESIERKREAYLKNKITFTKIEQEKNNFKKTTSAKVLAAKNYKSQLKYHKKIISKTAHNHPIDLRHYAPRPVSAKNKNGKLVCAHKHDHPHKSRENNKGKIHLDMECCLDPDEYPNPWCTYSSKNRKVSKYSFKDYLRKKSKHKHKKK